MVPKLLALASDAIRSRCKTKSNWRCADAAGERKNGRNNSNDSLALQKSSKAHVVFCRRGLHVALMIPLASFDDQAAQRRSGAAGNAAAKKLKIEKIILSLYLNSLEFCHTI